MVLGFCGAKQGLVCGVQCYISEQIRPHRSIRRLSSHRDLELDGFDYATRYERFARAEKRLAYRESQREPTTHDRPEESVGITTAHEPQRR